MKGAAQLIIIILFCRMHGIWSLVDVYMIICTNIFCIIDGCPVDEHN